MQNKEQNLPIKKIALVENLNKSSTAASCRMWHPYEITAKVAIDRFKEMNPTYIPEFLFLSSLTEVERGDAAADKIKMAKDQGALVVVGNAWSTTASVAAVEAARSKIPYVAPTAVTKEVHDGEWSVSVGVDVRQAATTIEGLLKNIDPSGPLVIIENSLRIQEREFSDAVRAKVPNSISFDTRDGYPYGEISKALKNNPNATVFFPGYTGERKALKKLATDFGGLKFIVGPQWAHDYVPLAIEFKGLKGLEIYCISDFYGVDNDDARYLAKKWKDYDSDYDQGGFRYALYDAIMLALQALNDKNVTSHEEVLEKLNNLGDAQVSTKTPLKIENGQVIKQLNIAKWDDTRFVKFEDSNPQSIN